MMKRALEAMNYLMADRALVMVGKEVVFRRLARVDRAGVPADFSASVKRSGTRLSEKRFASRWHPALGYDGGTLFLKRVLVQLNPNNANRVCGERRKASRSKKNDSEYSHGFSVVM